MSDQTMILVGKWNRKIHIYLGLYMLLFLWVFSISGLFMNHPDWFKHQGERSTKDLSVRMPDVPINMEKAKHIMEQLSISGEIIFRGKQKPGQFAFIAMRPNERVFVNTNLESSVAKVTTVKAEPTAMLEGLHTFSGIRGIWGESSSVRDWLPTQIWSFCMDALCVGLIITVISSIYMAIQIKQNRIWCLVSLVLGSVICSFFIWGLA